MIKTISRRDILRTATLDPARTMKRDAELGTVAPGTLADFALVDGDLMAHVSDVRNGWLIVKGVMYGPAEIYRSLGVAPIPGGERTAASMRGGGAPLSSDATPRSRSP